MITKRAPGSEPTEAEILCFQNFCERMNIVREGTGTTQFATYLLQQWGVVIDDESMTAALPRLLESGAVTLYSETQQKYLSVGQEDFPKADKLNAWFLSPANRRLVNTGNENIINQTAVLSELRGREINPKTIQDAIGRLMARGTKLFFMAVVRTPDPRQKKDDGTRMEQPRDPRYRADGRLDHSYKPPSEQVTEAPAGSPDAWETFCQRALAWGTPSQHTAMVETFEKGRASGKSFREVYQDLQLCKKQFEKSFIPR